jgi:hypothetical protein
MKKCLVCGTYVPETYKKFCSKKCKVRHNSSYPAQQARGLERKTTLVKQKGGCCEHCGYRKNLSALQFHHIDPTAKLGQVDMRSLSNHSWEWCVREVAKCQLLCANCHSELHNPHLDITSLS